MHAFQHYLNRFSQQFIISIFFNDHLRLRTPHLFGLHPRLPCQPPTFQYKFFEFREKKNATILDEIQILNKIMNIDAILMVLSSCFKNRARKANPKIRIS